jgi:DNA polymerase III subunit epsilon
VIVTGFDLETTGLLEPPDHRIVEIAAIVYEYEPSTHAHKLRASWVQRVNPQRPIDPKAQEVHGISFEDVAHQPRLEDVAERLVKILAVSDVVVAHNGVGFDFPFVRKELQRIGRPVPEFVGIDTMLDARWATAFGKLPNLGELCFACGVDYDPAKAHSAEYDVQVMMDSFFRARRKGFFKLPKERNDELAAHHEPGRAAA